MKKLNDMYIATKIHLFETFQICIDILAVPLNTYVYSELYNSVYVCVFITQYGIV